MIEPGDLVEYVARVHERTRDVVSTIPSELLGWRASAGEFTLAEIAAHIARARVWNAELVTGDAGARYGGHDASDCTTPEALLGLMDESSRQALALVEAADLEREIPSSMGEIAAWRRVFGGLIEHEVHHRSQLAALLSLHGIAPPALFGLFEEDLRR